MSETYSAAVWADLLIKVASHFHGKPTTNNAKEMRFGTRGSLRINKKLGTWYNFETGEKGGAVDLIRVETGIKDKHEALAWAEREGYWRNGQAPGWKPTPEPKPKPREVAIYSYTDESGNPLYEKVRYEPKDFRLRRPDGKGGHIYNIEGVRSVCFRLPELIEAIANERLVVLGEGEKAANALWAIGVPASCGPGGAGSWDDELTETFRDADVVICGDHDDAGRKFNDNVSVKLTGVARRIRVLYLVKVWPECPVKGDPFD